MRKYLLLSFALLTVCSIAAQDFSNKGKDFWVGYGYHEIMVAGNSQDMVLYFATDSISNVTVSIPGLGYSVTYNNIAAGTVFQTPPIPKGTGGQPDARLNTDGASSKGIHITSDNPIIAYAHVYNASVSGATILYPTNTLGKDYYSVNYKNISNTTNANCWFYVVATDTGTTTVKIVPSANTIGGWTAGSVNYVTLTQGQIYNVMGTVAGFTGVDLTGSKITSIASGNAGCKRIAVFSGSGRIAISCNGSAPSSDNYMVQAMPKSAWGKKYLTVPTANYTSTNGTGLPLMQNIYRICVLDPTTVVTVNGSPIAVPLQGNFYYELAASTTLQRIEGDKPIMVAQYLPSQGNSGCGPIVPGDGDPEVIYLSATEQSINSVRWDACKNSAINPVKHYINIVIPNSGTAISSCKLDGVTIPAARFTVHPQDPNYSYAVIGVSGEVVASVPHAVTSDSGFNAIAYGYGPAESYGYNAGTNIKDLYQQVGVSTQYGTETSPSVCTNSPFKFKVSLPYIPDSLYWNFHAAAGMQPNNTNVMVNNTGNSTLDSTTIVNGKTIYWYSIHTFYDLTLIGTYPITLTTYSQNADSCGTSQDIDFNLIVTAPPAPGFTWSGSGCVAEPVQFTETTPQSPKPTYKWWWNFGDPASGVNDTSNLRNPTHTFSAPGTYTIKYAAITTPGCLTDTIPQQITVNPLPSATISGTSTVCINTAQPNITFTGTGGTLPYTFTYQINGGSFLTVNSSAGSNIATVSVPTNVAGTFVYTLDSVSNTGSTLCVQNITGQSATVIVNTDATINLTSAPGTDNQTLCINNAITNIVYTIGGGAGASISAGSLPTGVSGIFNAGVFTISGTPTVSGVYNYTVSTTGPCTNYSLSGTITVNDNSTLILSSAPGTNIQSLCNNNTPITNITYLVGGTATGISITSGALPTGVNGSYSGGVFTISGIPTVSGVFNYTVTTSGPCINVSLSGTITVFALPTASFNFTSPSCETRLISFTDASAANSGTLSTWAWDFGDPASGTANASSLQNPTHTYATAGVYTVTLSVTNSNGCISNPIASIPLTINASPLAGFIIPQVCLNDPYAQFTDTSKVNPGTIVGWNWNFGDPGSGAANTSTLQNPQHSYSAVGPYNVQLIVTSNTGCKDTIVQILIVNGFPVANFTINNPTILCANDSVSILNTSTVSPGVITKVEIYWDNAGQPAVFQTDNFPYSGKVYKHLYPNFQTPLTKLYNIRFRAYSGGVCVNDKIQTITINAAPKVQFNQIPNTCLNVAPFQITQASETGGVPGSYVFSGPGVSSSGMFNPLLVGPGTYTIKYTYTSSAAGCVDSASQQINVLVAPVANFSLSSPFCETKPITFTDASASTVGSLTNWTWDFGDGTALVINNTNAAVIHTFSVTGIYNVKLFVTTSDGCNSLVKQLPVIVSPLPKPDFRIPASVCLPVASVTFNNTSTIADGTQSSFVYLWNFGDPASGLNNTSVSKSPVHNYINLGPFNVNLKVTSGNGCIADTVIVFNNIHPQPIAGFTSDKPSICISDNVTFTDNSQGLDGTIMQWNWNFGDGQTSISNPITHLFLSPGTFQVSLFIINSNGCNSDTLVKPFTVYPSPVISIIGGSNLFVLEGNSKILQPVVTGTNLQFLWTPSLYMNNNTLQNPTIRPLDDIAYTLKVVSSGGCTSFDNIFVKVLKYPRIPNTFTPNNDGINDTWKIEYLNTYPDNHVQVFTRTGQLVFESHGYKTPWDGTYKGKPLPFDTYYYIIEPGSGRNPITGYVTIIK